MAAMFLTLATALMGQPQLVSGVKIHADDLADGDRFGTALATCGDVLVVTAQFGETVYFYRYDGLAWNLESQAPSSQRLGRNPVAIDGDTVLTGSDPVRVYRYVDGQWSGTDTIDARAAALLLIGDTAFIGAVSSAPLSYQVRVYAYDGVGWSPRASIVPDHAAADQFGAALHFDPTTTTLVIGAPASNAVYVYGLIGDAWMPTQLMVPTRSGVQGFGTAVAIQQDLLIIGAAEGGHAGSVHIYALDQGQWQVQQILEAGSPGLPAGFGSALVIHDDRIVVGHPSTVHVGKVHVYENDGAEWLESVRLIGCGSSTGARLGASLAIRGDRLLVGAPGDIGNQPRFPAASGAIFEYDLLTRPNDCAGLECDTQPECCDTDGDGVRDHGCQWCVCDEVCSVMPVAFGDVGQFGPVCEPDGACGAMDGTITLVCFAQQVIGGSTCALATEGTDLMIDIGGPFGACAPDGYCNIHDRNHAVMCYVGTSPCTTCSPGPEPPPVVAGKVHLALHSARSVVRPGDRIEVAVRIASDGPACQGVQIHVAASGGSAGQLVLERIDVEGPAAAGPAEQAVNTDLGQFLAFLEFGTMALERGARLATYTYRVADDARGSFVLDIRHDEAAGDQTFLIAPDNGRIEVAGTTPLVVRVDPPALGARPR